MKMFLDIWGETVLKQYRYLTMTATYIRVYLFMNIMYKIYF